MENKDDNLPVKGNEIHLKLKVNSIVTGNKLYSVGVTSKNKGYIRKSNEARRLQQSIVDRIVSLIDEIPTYELDIDNLKYYHIDVDIIRNRLSWYCKNKKVRKIDLTNIWKTIEDALIRGLNYEYLDEEKVVRHKYDRFDDSLCFRQTLSKVVDDSLDSDEIVFNIKLIIMEE